MRLGLLGCKMNSIIVKTDLMTSDGLDTSCSGLELSYPCVGKEISALFFAFQRISQIFPCYYPHSLKTSVFRHTTSIALKLEEMQRKAIHFHTSKQRERERGCAKNEDFFAQLKSSSWSGPCRAIFRVSEEKCESYCSTKSLHLSPLLISHVESLGLLRSSFTALLCHSSSKLWEEHAWRNTKYQGLEVMNVSFGWDMRT